MSSQSNSTKHLVGLFPDLAGTGGVQESGRLSALALQNIAKQQNWTVDFLSLNGAPGDHSLSFGTDIIPFRGFDRRKIRFALSAVRSAMRSSGSDGAVVLAAHSNLAPVATWMRRAASNAKIVVMGHGIEVWSPLPTNRRQALVAADLILAPSCFTAHKIAEVQGIPSMKIRRLPWPLSPSFLALAESKSKLRLPDGFPPGQVILSVGRWASNEQYKGADELIRAAALLAQKLPDVRLVLVGTGDDLPRLRRLAAESGGPAPCFLEGLSREQVAASYAAADIFALPSTGEGFGLVFLEAMAFGKPVVGAAAGGITDVIDDAVNGFLVPPGDSNALSSGLEKLLCDPALRSKLGQEGARKVHETYSFAVFQRKLMQIVGALMEGDQPPPETASLA